MSNFDKFTHRQFVAGAGAIAAISLCTARGRTATPSNSACPWVLHRHAMPDDETLQAVMFGPLVLAGRFDAVTPEQRYGGYGPHGTIFNAPEITAKIEDVSSWVQPVSGANARV